jgi:hypothetical protein
VKWRISDLHPPRWRFPKGRSRRFAPQGQSQPATDSAPELNWDFGLTDEMQEMRFTGSGGSAKRFGHLFLVEFDLKWPMKDRLDFAKRVLKRARDNYKSGITERGGRVPKGRRRFEDYDAHLKVWDLHRRSESPAQIANELFPRHHGDSVLQKVRDHLDAAQRLISGHYTEIV